MNQSGKDELIKMMILTKEKLEFYQNNSLNIKKIYKLSSQYQILLTLLEDNK